MTKKTLTAFTLLLLSSVLQSAPSLAEDAKPAPGTSSTRTDTTMKSTLSLPGLKSVDTLQLSNSAQLDKSAANQSASSASNSTNSAQTQIKVDTGVKSIEGVSKPADVLRMQQTEYPFTLPKGYVDGDGNLHR